MFLPRLQPSFRLGWRRRALRRLFRGLALLMALGLAGRLFFWCLVSWVDLPPQARALHAPSVRFLDSSGSLVHVERGGDHRWNFPLSYGEIPPEMVRFVLAVEDRRFWEHRGWDWRAAGRALWQFLRHRRIVSGGSTITMQVMTMRTGRSRSLGYKVRQTLLACQWERTHSKEEILEEYFNQLPYGGKLYGIEAAAQYYFGRHARELNRNEMILLSGLPQSPNRYRPDRHPERALRRREMVLHLLVRHGALTPQEAEEVRREPLRYRQFQTRLWPRMTDVHYLRLAQKAHPGRREYPLALDMRLQEQALAALRWGVDRLPGVADGAAVVVENATGRVRACVGTLDFLRAGDGAVNGAVAWRSPGSSWKPFLYGEALYGGMLVAETRLLDTPLELTDYRPGNFDGTFRGEVSAREALADSLNTPAVRLLAQLGVERFLQLLWCLNLLKASPGELVDKVGLSLAIGGTDSNLLALTAAYARLAGAPARLSWLQEAGQDTAGAEPGLWNEGSRQLLLQMLRRPLPGAGELPVSWKTGTSNGNRDAWCFAVTPQWTVGVWLGNKSGASSPALVGATAAAPVAGSLVQALSQQSPPVWPSWEEAFGERLSLCAASGLAPGAECGERMEGWGVKGVPLALCPRCGREGGEALKPVRILSPAPGEYRLEAGRQEVFFLLKTQPAECHLYVNGDYRGLHPSGEPLSLGKGAYRLTLWGGEGWKSQSITLRIR
ncbi:MAG: transglycosylase domain-containing protein [Oligosphaeraceae bacterium]